MALDYTPIEATTQEYIVPYLRDNIFDSTPTLTRMKTKVNKSQDGGKFIEQPIIYASDASTGHYNGWGTVDTAETDTITGVTYNWAFAYCTMAISRTDELKNSGKSGIVNLLKAKTQIARDTLAKTLTTDLFSATSVTNGIQGFPLMLDDSSTVEYAGIDTADFSGWASSIDSTSTTLTPKLLQGKFGDCSDGNEVPTLMIMNQDLFDKVWALYEVKPEFRIQNENRTLKFQAADIIVDKASPGTGSGTEDNHISFINENFIEFYVHPRDNITVSKWREPINQMGRIAFVTWCGQLATSNRRRHGALEALDPAL